MSQDPKPQPPMPLSSPDLLEARKESLRALFPEVFSEGRIDFAQLRRVLGDVVDPGKETFGLNWNGKADAIRAAQQSSTATLVPDPSASVDFESAEHVFIEGDNLEVLKLLQKAYCGQVKMIFIDPPYNTGGEFIYTDNYRDGLREYLQLTGQVDETGSRTSTVTDRSGRIHSRWLSMMYPRLFLARNLLSEDGVLFITIDDHEVQTLRLLLDEIFGPENFVASLVWRRKVSPANDATWFSNDHDHVLVYARTKTLWRPNRLPRTEAQTALYQNPDGDPRGPWSSATLTCNKSREERTNLYYAIRNPHTGAEIWPKATAVWRYGEDKTRALMDEGSIYWGADGTAKPRIKKFLSEARGVVPRSVWDYSTVGSTQEATTELNALVPGSGFDTAKPVRLIQQMLQLATNPHDADLVLDFFAGSGTTGHAVMQQNSEDGGNRRFITVQIPEPTATGRFDTIADITRTRLHAACARIRTTQPADLPAHTVPGFRAYTLAESNFKIWTPPASGTPSLEAQLKHHTRHLRPHSRPDAILTELLLKTGIPLTAPVETLILGGAEVHSVDGGRFLICLADPITVEVLHAIMARAPHRVLCLDHAFAGNDMLLANTALEMKARGVEHFRTV